MVDQLHKIPTQISILELLKISPAHKDIQERALVGTTVPNNLDIDQFQAMVGHLIVPHNLSFFEHDDVSLSHLHNTLLHIDVLVYKHRVKCVLIDGGAGLNIYTLKLVSALGFSEKVNYPKKKIITIKAYDDE